MAPSQVSGLKMRNLLFVVALGLFAVVHSTPVNPETQDDIYKEVRMEEFLIPDHQPTSATTQAPKRSSTQQPSTEFEESDTVEGSASGEDNMLSKVLPEHGGKQPTTTTLSMLSNTQSSLSKVLRRHNDHSSVPKAAHPFTDMDSGSGSGDLPEVNKVVIPGIVQQPQVKENAKSLLPQNSTGQGTPGWIIIVGFIVGVAALVMLCVAIATRDKWNGPKQAAQLETTTSSSNQQREQEMETFLLKEKPRENGKAAEYTVIPLDELPEKC